MIGSKREKTEYATLCVTDSSITSTVYSLDMTEHT